MIAKLNTSEVDVVDPVNDIDDDLNRILDLLNEIDADQENDVSSQKLKQLNLNAEKLLQDLKFIKTVFDSTDGYASSEEEDKTYDSISKDMGGLISHLKETIAKVKQYKADGNFADIDDFVDETTSTISSIEESLNNHTIVLKKISWKDKHAHRVEELKDALLDCEDIISDGNEVFGDLKKIQTAALKDPEGNAEIIEQLEEHVNSVNESLLSLEEQKTTLENINEAIQEFADSIENRDLSDFKQVTKLLKKNKDIKESIIKTNLYIDCYDTQIDNLIEFRDNNMKLIKKKYKAKKGDEIDEILGNFLDNSNTDVPIKRVGEGKYMIGDKKVSAKVINGNMLIRVGGGYETLEQYMESFGNAKLKREARKAKRGNKSGKKSQHQARTLRKSGTKRVVGSADLMRSFR